MLKMSANILSLLRNKDKVFVEKEIKSGKYDLNTVDSSGYSPILLAAVDGNSFAIELLVKEGVSFSDSDRPDGADWDPLHLAAAKGHLNVVKQLIAFGANVNAKDYRGNTPVSCALAAGHSKVFETLLLNGADLNVIADNAANLALKSLSVEMLRTVFSSGFEFHSLEEGTSFHYIIERDSAECCYVGYNSRKFIEVFDYLMSANRRDIDTQYADKGTPLTLAFTRRRHHFSSRLIKFGADVTKCDLARFRFSSDAIIALKYLFYSGFRFNLNFFRNNCHPLTPKNQNLRREMEISCCKPSCAWLTDDEFHNEILSFNQFCKWIEMQTTTPPTLKTAARIAVRKGFRTFTGEWLTLNNVPQSLQNYIFLNDV